ncbi:MAG: tetratricopeptide repeat protein [Candidatus Neomarinimicrobiota bacterium]|nr:MAG: tetratricopeptide repeat protein [Candidatus Neomarinimicrobiota bacterium]
MRHRNIILLALLYGHLIWGQDFYHSLDEIQKEWKDYTTFQRAELLNFCNFLYESHYYDRAVISLYQFLYRFPGDRMEDVVYYKLARSLEETGKFVEARRYYRELLPTLDSATVTFQAARYHDLYLQYRLALYDTLVAQLRASRDPYDLLTLGYTYLAQADYASARQAFFAAEEVFDDTYYLRRIDPILHMIDSVQVLPRKKKWISLFSSLVPGGGKAYVRDWESAGGLAATTSLAFWIAQRLASAGGTVWLVQPLQELVPDAKYLQKGAPFTVGGGHFPRGMRLRTSGRKYWWMPVGVGAGVYVASIWHSVSMVAEVNQRQIDQYVVKWVQDHPLKELLDFPEPELDKSR